MLLLTKAPLQEFCQKPQKTLSNYSPENNNKFISLSYKNNLDNTNLHNYSNFNIDIQMSHKSLLIPPSLTYIYLAPPWLSNKKSSFGNSKQNALVLAK